MQTFNSHEKLAAEHYRLHSVEQWPDGPRKQAAVRAVESTLESLSRHPDGAQGTFACIVCQGRKGNVKILEPREVPRVRRSLDDVGSLERTG
jgi:hypothetical protein